MRLYLHSLMLLMLLLPVKDVLAAKQDYCAEGDGRIDLQMFELFLQSLL